MIYQIAGYPFELTVTSETVPELAHQLHAGLKATLSAFEQQDIPTEPAIQHGVYYFGSSHGSLTCRSGPYYHDMHLKLLIEASNFPFERLLVTYESSIINQAVREAAPHFWIHGACLCRGDETILLVADSGTGKSTISLGLTTYGYKLITDDIIIYDLAERHFIPLPRSPKIEGDAPERLSATGFQLSSQENGAQSDGYHIKPYVVLAENHWQPDPIPGPPDRVYFMKRGPDYAAGISEVDSSNSLLALLPASNLVAIDPQLTMATQFFADTRFISIHLDNYLDDLRLIAEG